MKCNHMQHIVRKKTNRRGNWAKFACVLCGRKTRWKRITWPGQ